MRSQALAVMRHFQRLGQFLQNDVSYKVMSASIVNYEASADRLGLFGAASDIRM